MEHELYHYGVLGMKWGHRKANSGNRNANIKNRKKLEKQQFKKDYKNYRKNRNHYDFSIDSLGNMSNIRNSGDTILQNLRTKKGEEYVNKILKKSKRRDRATKVGLVGSSAVALVGARYLKKKLE